MDDILTNFVDKILDLSLFQSEVINGRVYTNKPANLITTPLVAPLKTCSLTSIVDYIGSMAKSGGDAQDQKIIFIESPNKVSLRSPLDNENQRQEFVSAYAKPCAFPFGQWVPTAKFIIDLQACFQDMGSKPDMLQYVGNLVAENIKTSTDDGVSQKAVVMQSAASKAVKTVPNPVELQPYRTFLEVEQPESQFIFRLKFEDRTQEFHCGLWPADGDGWESTAIQHIRDWFLVDAIIAPLVDSGVIIILA